LFLFPLSLSLSLSEFLPSPLSFIPHLLISTSHQFWINYKKTVV
jgi:hypothetical protein